MLDIVFECINEPPPLCKANAPADETCSLSVPPVSNLIVSSSEPSSTCILVSLSPSTTNSDDEPCMPNSIFKGVPVPAIVCETLIVLVVLECAEDVIVPSVKLPAESVILIALPA